MPAPLRYYRALKSPKAIREIRAIVGAGPIVVPTLYLHGERDGCIGPELADGQEQHYSALFETVKLAEAGHCLAPRATRGSERGDSPLVRSALAASGASMRSDADERKLAPKIDVVGDGDRVASAETGTAKTFAADRTLQSFEREIAEAVRGHVVVHLGHGVVRSDELFARRCVDAVETRPDRGRRADSQMNFFGARSPGSSSRSCDSWCHARSNRR